MKEQTKALLTAGLLAVTLLAPGCQLFPGARTGSSEQSANSATTKDNAPPSATNKNAATTTKPATSNLPAAQDLNLQANHPNGAVLRVTKISYSDDHIALGISVTNGHKEEIKLNGYNDLILRDNLGNRYNLAPPPQNPEVRVQSGSSLNGTFNFLGRINPAANSLTLTTNDKFGNDNDFSRTPKMTIDNISVQRAAS